MKLRRLPQPEYADGSRYFHPNGYIIDHERRSWSERNGNQVGGGTPLWWWAVRPANEAGDEVAEDQPGWSPYGRECDTLAEARAWCDERPDGRAL